MNFDPIKNKRKLVLKNFFQIIYVYRYITDFRAQTRKFLVHNAKIILNGKVLIGCFPILFGVSKTFHSKYQNQTFSNLFQRTLPGLSSEHVQISWPTFEQIFAHKLESEFVNSFISPKSNSYINRVDFYANSVVVKAHSNWNTKQKQLYTGFFSPIQCNNSKTYCIGNNWYNISLSLKNTSKSQFCLKKTSKKNWILNSTGYNGNTVLVSQKFIVDLNKNYLNTLYLNLDELPHKLRSGYAPTIQQNDYTNQQILTKSHIPAHSDDTFFSLQFPTKSQQLLQQKMFVNKKIHYMSKFFSGETRILNFNSDVFLKGIQNSILQEISKKSEFETDFLSSRSINSQQKNLITHDVSEKLGFKKIDFLENKIKEIFYEKNLICFSTFNYINFLNDLSENKKFISLISPDFEFILQFLNDEKPISTTSFINESFPLSNASEILQIIQDIFSSTKNTVTLPREMSGYIFPDVYTHKNVSMITQFFYKKTNDLVHTIFQNKVSNFTNISTIQKSQFKNFKYRQNSQLPLWNPILSTKITQNFSHSSNFLHTKFNSVNLKLPYSPINYFSVDLGRMVYQGPSIFHNRTTNQLHIDNKKQVKQWINHILDADNPLSDRRESFFGKNLFARYLSNKNSTKSDSSALQQKDKMTLEAVKVGVLNKGRSLTLFEMSLRPVPLNNASQNNKNNTARDKNNLSQNNKNNATRYKQVSKPDTIISCDKYSYITYLTESEWDVFITKALAENAEKKAKQNFVNKDESDILPGDIFPIINVRTLPQKSIFWPLVQFDYTSSNPILNFLTLRNHYFNTKFGFNKITTNQINTNLFTSHYFPYSKNLISRVLTQKNSFGKIYKKSNTIYQNKHFGTFFPSKFISKKSTQSCSEPSPVFHHIVEPISWDSWLFVTQFSIGLFLMYMLKFISQKYGKELQYIFASLYKTELPSDFDLDESSEQENFRIIQHARKRFRDVVGIDTILPELSEIVWFLRNSGRSFPIGNTISRRILLTGPPGTGKTLVVQAIAGESEVPVLIESGSSLAQSKTSETSSERLHRIFQHARKIAPCIIFIDEIDTFGQARDQMSRTTEVLHSIYSNNSKSFQNNFQIQNSDFIPQPKFGYSNENSGFFQDEDEDSQHEMNRNMSKNHQSTLLMQFLVELDGISTEKKIIVFGATNRPQILDAALTRPGRFNKTFHLGLPAKQKRIEIFKLYSKNLGIHKNISWNYLANSTSGLSAADLASVMNQSAMKAIENETIHTIQTIEYGLETISGYRPQKNKTRLFIQSSTKSTLETTKNNLKLSKLLFVNRLAYYQAGKALIHTLLKHHPPVISIYLWPQLKNKRYHLVTNIIEKEFSQFHTRIELESRIIGFYAGKAAELIALSNGFKNKNSTSLLKNNQIITPDMSSYFWQSDLGVQDMNFAGWIAQLMISKWYIYSKKTILNQFNQLQDNSNFEQIKDNEVIELFEKFSSQIESRYQNVLIKPNSQNWVTRSSLQQEILKKSKFSHPQKNSWSKIYDEDLEENENTQYIFPDDYYHNNTYLNNLLHFTYKKFPLSSVSWNDILNWNRDFIYQSLILACFNKAIFILDENREILDFFANYLMQKEIIREYEILNFMNTFKK